MISQKIQALFDFIDFLDENKSQYIEKYIPLCDELKELDKQRNLLNPNGNYKDKQSYDIIQKQIKEKFEPITENIYKPITSKLQELGIWSGDDTYSSIHNNNISEISEIQRNFTNEDVEQIMQYKQKYLQFRNDTNSDFLCLGLVIDSLDEILKELFDFFKDTNENEFENFEAKTIKVKNVKELAENISNNRNANVKYSLPIETFLNTKTEKTISPNITNEIIMGNKVQVGNISNNSGQIAIGEENKIKSNGNDELSKKSFNWTKWGIIIGTILTIISIIVAIKYS